jgi:hypothetical protein
VTNDVRIHEVSGSSQGVVWCCTHRTSTCVWRDHMVAQSIRRADSPRDLILHDHTVGPKPALVGPVQDQAHPQPARGGAELGSGREVEAAAALQELEAAAALGQVEMAVMGVEGDDFGAV